MRKMYLLFSHKLTKDQIEDAKKNLEIDEFVYLSNDLQKQWSNVPTDLKDLTEYAKVFEDYLIKNAKVGDYVLIQGDFGLVYKMVNFSKKINLKPVYATTKRVSKDVIKDGKVIKVSEFKHIQFREYN